jgi:hypothetical protein
MLSRPLAHLGAVAIIAGLPISARLKLDRQREQEV